VQKTENKKTAIDLAITAKQAEIEQSDALIKAKDKDLAVKVTEGEGANNYLKNDLLKRRELFGEKIVDDEETNSLGKLKGLEKIKEKATESLLEKKQQLSTNTIRINDLGTEIQMRQTELGKNEKHFIVQLRKAGFADEKNFVVCKIPTDQRTKLETEQNLLQTRKTQLDARKVTGSKVSPLRRQKNSRKKTWMFWLQNMKNQKIIGCAVEGYWRIDPKT